jgi:AbrB family looped-hinge helix DNA binding protein
MERVTLSPKFQIVIPKSIREEMGLRSGQKLNLILYKKQLRVFPAKDIRELRGSLKGMNTEIDWDRDS